MHFFNVIVLMGECLWVIAAPAQAIYPARPVIWHMGQAVLDRGIDLGDPAENAIWFEAPDLRITQKINCPDGTLYKDLLEGVPYINIIKRNKAESTIEVARWDGEAWQSVGTFTCPKPHVRIHPLQNGKFLAVADQPLFKQDNGYTPFAILSLRKGEFQVSEVLEAGFDAPVWKPDAVTGKARCAFTSAMLPFSLALISIRTPEHLTFVCDAIGHIFTFKAKDGAWQRTKKVFSSLEGQVLHDLKRAQVVLGCQPKPDGHILLATRTEEGVLFSQQHRPTTLPPSVTDDPAALKTAVTASQKAFEEGLKAYPRILWWDYDPHTGSLQPEAPPMQFPDRLTSYEQYRQFLWRFKADGNLLLLGRSQLFSKPQEGRKRLGLIGLK